MGRCTPTTSSLIIAKLSSCLKMSGGIRWLLKVKTVAIVDGFDVRSENDRPR